jgi:deazaflavin-dependent oxidoreductase (nitroreductase family)
MRGRYLERTTWAVHRALDRASGGRYRSERWGRPPTLWITTVGRRTGRTRESALIYAADGINFVVAASNAGQPHDPAWWLNLRERPDTEIRLGRERHRVRARRASAEESGRLWPRLDAVYPTFARYRARTTRLIPVLVLEPQ